MAGLPQSFRPSKRSFWPWHNQQLSLSKILQWLKNLTYTVSENNTPSPNIPSPLYPGSKKSTMSFALHTKMTKPDYDIHFKDECVRQSYPLHLYSVRLQLRKKASPIVKDAKSYTQNIFWDNFGENQPWSRTACLSAKLSDSHQYKSWMTQQHNHGGVSTFMALIKH